MLFTKQQDDDTQKDQSEASLVEVRMLEEVVGDTVSHNGYLAFKTIDLKKLRFPRVLGERRENLKCTLNGLIVVVGGEGVLLSRN